MVEPKPNSDDAAQFGLADKPTVILIRPCGEEFGRLEGEAVQEARLNSLIDLYQREGEILEAGLGRSPEAQAEVVDLYLAQRRLSASIVAWKELSRLHTSVDVCSLARRIADLSLEMVRHDEAIPLLEFVRTHHTDEVAKLEAWSRLIWCHLTLGNTEAARQLSNDPERPSARLQG